MPLARHGVPLFYELMRRRSPQHFYAFDLLWAREARPAGPAAGGAEGNAVYAGAAAAFAGALRRSCSRERHRAVPGRARARRRRDRGEAGGRGVHAGGNHLGENQKSGVLPGRGAGGVFRGPGTSTRVGGPNRYFPIAPFFRGPDRTLNSQICGATRLGAAYYCLSPE